MSRQRVSGEMEGIVFSMTIVVSFHGTFVTKVDKAYRCMCFFRLVLFQIEKKNINPNLKVGI